jgi:hypothetical protein
MHEGVWVEHNKEEGKENAKANSTTHDDKDHLTRHCISFPLVAFSAEAAWNNV